MPIFYIRVKNSNNNNNNLFNWIIISCIIFSNNSIVTKLKMLLNLFNHYNFYQNLHKYGFLDLISGLKYLIIIVCFISDTLTQFYGFYLLLKLDSMTNPIFSWRWLNSCNSLRAWHQCQLMYELYWQYNFLRNSYLNFFVFLY